MIRPLSLLAFAVLTSAASVTNNSVTFRTKAFQVGDRRTDSSQMSMEMTIDTSMGGEALQSIDQSQSENEEFRVTVLAVDGDQVTKVALHCLAARTSSSMVDGDSTQDGPLVGKTLIGIWRDGSILIQSPEGDSVEGDVGEAARAQCAGYFEADENEFAALLPDRPIKLGEEIHVDTEAARKAFGEDASLEDVDLTLRLKAIQLHEGQACGLFSVVLKMGGEASEGVHVSVTLTGDLLLATETSWPLRLSLGGDMEVTGGVEGDVEGMDIQFEGRGAMRIERRVTYQKTK